MKKFENKVAVITGAAGGIGEATTRRIVAEGGKVVIADYMEERAKELASELEKDGADVRSVYFTATELESCRHLIIFAEEQYGHIDILINNVGGTDLSLDRDIETLDIDYFDEAFHINLRCAIYLTQLAIPEMIRQGGGNFVNVASISGITADFRGTYYGVAKAGLIAFTKYVATQMGKKNIRCNAVAPGLTLTPAALRNLSEEVQRIYLRHNSLDYLGKPEDIAAAITFLASEDARYITGQTIVVDGGTTIHNPAVAEMMGNK